MVRTNSTRQALRETAQWLMAQREALDEQLSQHSLLDGLEASLSDLEQYTLDAATWAEEFLSIKADEQGEWRFEHGVVADELRRVAADLAVGWQQNLEAVSAF